MDAMRKYYREWIDFNGVKDSDVVLTFNIDAAKSVRPVNMCQYYKDFEIVALIEKNNEELSDAEITKIYGG